jgi:BlaI family penicillinase repressor
MFGSPPRLGKVQLRIMQFLWDNGPATARQITDALARQEPIAHSTVQTLLRKLETKGAVAHEIADRTFVFRPLFGRTEVNDSALHDVLTHVFHGSVYGLVSQLLAYEKLSPEELSGLRRLIERSEKGDGDDGSVE